MKIIKKMTIFTLIFLAANVVNPLKGMEEKKGEAKKEVTIQLRYRHPDQYGESKKGIFASVDYLPKEATILVPVNEKGNVRPITLSEVLAQWLYEKKLITPEQLHRRASNLTSGVSGYLWKDVVKQYPEIENYPLANKWGIKIFRKGSRPGSPPLRDLFETQESDILFPLSDVEKNTMYAVLDLSYKHGSDHERKVIEFRNELKEQALTQLGLIQQ
jgi:hypothetical protein